MKSYRVFLFDADETLFDFQRAEAGALASAFASFGFDCDASVCAQYHRLNDALCSWRLAPSQKRRCNGCGFSSSATRWISGSTRTR